MLYGLYQPPCSGFESLGECFCKRLVAGLANHFLPKGVRSAGSTCMLSSVMSWLAWLGLAVLLTAVAAITGIKPKGTRHIAHTRLMGAARLVLLALVIIFAYLAFRARSGG